MVCEHCRKETPDGNLYCENCGAKQNVTKTSDGATITEIAPGETVEHWESTEAKIEKKVLKKPSGVMLYCLCWIAFILIVYLIGNLL